MEQQVDGVTANQVCALSLRRLPDMQNDLVERVNQLCGQSVGYPESFAQRIWTAGLLELHSCRTQSFGISRGKRQKQQQRCWNTFMREVAPILVPRLEEYLCTALGDWVCYGLYARSDDGFHFRKEFGPDFHISMFGELSVFREGTRAAVKSGQTELNQKETKIPFALRSKLDSIFQLIKDLVELPVTVETQPEKALLQGSAENLDRFAQAFGLYARRYAQNLAELLEGYQVPESIITLGQRFEQTIGEFAHALGIYREEDARDELSYETTVALEKISCALTALPPSIDINLLLEHFANTKGLSECRRQYSRWILLKLGSLEIFNHTSYLVWGGRVEFNLDSLASVMQFFLSDFATLEQLRGDLDRCIESMQDESFGQAFQHVFCLHDTLRHAARRLSAYRDCDLDQKKVIAGQLQVVARYINEGYSPFYQASKKDIELPKSSSTISVVPMESGSEVKRALDRASQDYHSHLHRCCYQLLNGVRSLIEKAKRPPAAQQSRKRKRNTQSGPIRSAGGGKRKQVKRPRIEVTSAEEPGQPALVEIEEAVVASQQRLSVDNNLSWWGSRLADLAECIKVHEIIGDTDRERRVELRQRSRYRLQLVANQLQYLLRRLEGNHLDERHFGSADEVRCALDLCRQLWEAALNACRARYSLLEGEEHILFSGGSSVGAPNHGHDLWAGASTLVAASTTVPLAVRSQIKRLRPVLMQLSHANQQLHYANRFNPQSILVEAFPLKQLLSSLSGAYRNDSHDRKVALSQQLLHDFILPAPESIRGLLLEENRAVDTSDGAFKQKVESWLNQQSGVSLNSTVSGSADQRMANVQAAQRGVTRVLDQLQFFRQMPIHYMDRRRKGRENRRNGILSDLQQQLNDLNSNLARRCKQGSADLLDAERALLLALRALREGYVAALINQNYFVNGAHLVDTGDEKGSLSRSNDLALLSRHLRQGSSEQVGFVEAPNLDSDSYKWVPRAYRLLKNPAYQSYHRKSVDPENVSYKLYELYIDQQVRLAWAQSEGWTTVIGGEALNPEEVANNAIAQAHWFENRLFQVITLLEQLITTVCPMERSGDSRDPQSE